MTTIGWQHDEIKYRKSMLCYIGIHRAAGYVIARIDGIDYFVCKDCGKRYKII